MTRFDVGNNQPEFDPDDVQIFRISKEYRRGYSGKIVCVETNLGSLSLDEFIEHNPRAHVEKLLEWLSNNYYTQAIEPHVLQSILKILIGMGFHITELREYIAHLRTDGGNRLIDEIIHLGYGKV